MMDKQIVDKFIEILSDCDYEAFSYSGRGMFGERCVAISGHLDVPDVMVDIMLAMVENCYDNGDMRAILEILKDTHTDNMGRGHVLYWPSAVMSVDEEVDE